MPLLIGLARFLLSSAAFVAVEAIFERIIKDDDESYIDEIAGIVAAVTFYKKDALVKGMTFLKNMPLPVSTKTGATPQTAKEVADYLKDIIARREGFAKMNAAEGGFAPLRIKLMQKVADFLTFKGALKIAGAGFIVSFFSWLVWAPSQIQQWFDQGVFAPEQGNKIFETLGMPWRWPISEQRETETQLKETQLEKNLRQLSTNVSALGAQKPEKRTIIRLVEDKKPEQFIGTLFSAKLGRAEAFERKIDDEITSMDDLEDDAKININRWLRSLPNRLGYSIVIRKDPVDEYGVKQSGVWATATIHIRRLAGNVLPIDTILLGPVEPKTRLEITRQSKSTETQISEVISAAEVREVEAPNGVTDIFSPDGERISLGGTVAVSDAGNTSGSINNSATKQGTSAKEVKKTELSDERRKEIEDEIKELTKVAADIQKQIDEGDFDDDSNSGNRSSTSTDQEAGRKGFVNTPGSVLNVRTSPSLKGAVFFQAPHNSPVTLTGKSVNADGFTWVQANVSIPNGGGSGWIAREFVHFV